MSEPLAERLGIWVAATLGWPPNASITTTRIGTGHSRAMYVVEASGAAERVVARVVARVEQGGVFGTTSAEECRVMRGLHAAGFPVAEIVAQDLTGTAIGQPVFVMSFIEGDLHDDERILDHSTAASFVATLAHLHGLDSTALGFDLVPVTPNEATHLQIERWHALVNSSTEHRVPLIDEAAAWLHHFAPPLDRLAVVHGDAGPGNLVHRDGTVLALTDWEFAHLGDPAEDWSFCLTMRGSRTMDRDQWLAMFRDHAGVQFDPATWRYWEAFNLFKGACANRSCLPLFRSGANRSPNLAIIGTTLHQVFLRRLAQIVHS